MRQLFTAMAGLILAACAGYAAPDGTSDKATKLYKPTPAQDLAPNRDKTLTGNALHDKWVLRERERFRQGTGAPPTEKPAGASAPAQ